MDSLLLSALCLVASSRIRISSPGGSAFGSIYGNHPTPNCSPTRCSCGLLLYALHLNGYRSSYHLPTILFPVGTWEFCFCVWGTHSALSHVALNLAIDQRSINIFVRTSLYSVYVLRDNISHHRLRTVIYAQNHKSFLPIHSLSGYNRIWSRYMSTDTIQCGSAQAS